MTAHDRRTNFFFPEGKRDRYTEEDFVSEVHRRFSTKQKSVMILLMDVHEQSVLMIHPTKVDWAECQMVFPQGRLTRRSNKPTEDASLILRAKAGVRLSAPQLHYIGYGFTQNHSNNKQDGKILHVVGGMSEGITTMAPTDYASLVAWIPIPSLDGYMEQLFSDRKRRIVQQAVLHAPEKSSTFKARALQDYLSRPSSMLV